MSDREFMIRSYGKSELAMLYFPNLTKQSAMKKMRHWLEINPRLRHLINKNARDYTPQQVRKIVGEVGEPYDT